MYTTLISTDTLAGQLANPDFAIVDCRFALADTARGRADYLNAHIPGAVYAHLDEDLSGPIVPGVTGRHPLPDPAAFARTLGVWGIGASTQVVAYDDAGGSYAARLWWMLRWLGHDAVAVLDGGWQMWVKEGRATRNGQETRAPREFAAEVRSDRVVSAREVDVLRSDPAARVLDARAPDRFRGENETIDPVAGHIPGAVSAFWQGNLAADGRFLDPAALRARYAGLIGEAAGERVVCYCGSGVTAAHNVLALAHAGIDDSRLYAGSWSEWITDPTRPVERGASPD